MDPCCSFVAGRLMFALHQAARSTPGNAILVPAPGTCTRCLQSVPQADGLCKGMQALFSLGFKYPNASEAWHGVRNGRASNSERGCAVPLTHGSSRSAVPHSAKRLSPAWPNEGHKWVNKHRGLLQPAEAVGNVNTKPGCVPHLHQ